MSRNWLDDDLVHSWLPALRKLDDSAKGRKAADRLFVRMRDNWAIEHGLTSIQQQQSCMDQTRRAIRDELGENHWSLEIIRFSREDYIEINDFKQKRVGERNEAIQQLDDPDAIVAVAVRLLESPKWAEVAAGLAVLTGRRVAELLATASFTEKSRWSVTFSGAVKRGTEEGLTFEIPTLTTAQRVCLALAKVRRELPSAPEMSPSEINRHYEQAVARACDEHFSELVPLREGRASLYTHLFRAVYATIATFWYCPPSVNDTEFKAAIQGHFQILNEQKPELRRSLSASRHYADYEISDHVIALHQGKRKGIKLGHAGIEVIDMFKQATPRTSPRKKGKRQEPTSVRLWKDDKALLEALFDRMGLNGDGKQENRMQALLEWVDAHLNDGDSDGSVVQPAVATTVAVPTAADPLRADLQELTATLKLLFLQEGSGAVPAAAAVGNGQTRRTQPRQSPPPPPPVDQPPDTGQLPDATSQPPKKRTRAATGQMISRINSAIDAIMAWNDAPDRLHDEKWAITINALKSFATSAPSMISILEQRKAEIEKHHQFHQLDPAKHNYVHRGKIKIANVIHLQDAEA